MSRVRPIHPPLIAAFPVLSLYSANLSLVPLPQVWRPLGIAIGGAALVWLVAGALTRNAERGAMVASAATVGIFTFGWLMDAMREAPPTVSVGLWAVLTLGLILALAWRPRLTQALNVLSVMLVAVTLVRAGSGILQTRARTNPTGEAAVTAAKTRPDIFYIILDGYGRHDALRRAIGYDNAFFVEGLRKRGFYVADRSRSNYCQTELSLASSLNMETIPKLLPNARPEDENRSPLSDLIYDNAVVREARRQGYGIMSVTTGFPPVAIKDPDLQVEGEGGLTLVESALFQMTPFRLRASTIESQFVVRRHRLLYAFSALESLAGRTSGPRFVLAHILAPHPPFVFAADGSPLRPKGPYGYWDGSDYDTYVGDDASYRKGYAGQADYVGHRILRVVDRLLAAPGPRPIIVIQGDHGSKVGLDQDSLERTDLNEVFPILNAYFVPENIRAKLTPDITPVNSFRVLFGGLFGLPLERLPDRSWYSTYPRPFALTDVTDRVR
jgi:hypothetical protein